MQLMNEESRRFLIPFTPTDLATDPLPIKVYRNNISKDEVVGQAIHWTFEYLFQRNCPTHLMDFILGCVREEIQSKIVPLFDVPPNSGNDIDGPVIDQDTFREPLNLMHTVITTVDNFVVNLIGVENDEELEKRYPAIYETGRKWDHIEPGELGCYHVSYYSMKNTRRTMEDKLVVFPHLEQVFGLDNYMSYFAVFDGHNGAEAAAYVAAQLHQILIQNVKKSGDIKESLTKAFKETDELFLEKCRSEKIRSGTTAVSVVMNRKKLYVAWVGDSQAAYFHHKESAEQLVLSHKPDREDERERIQSVGGDVIEMSGTWRVNGNLAVSRSLGDVDYKDVIISTPDIVELDADGLAGDYLVLASDGLWDVMNHTDIRTFVDGLIQSDAGFEAANLLASEAKRKGSSDNITVIVVYLQPMENLKCKSAPPSSIVESAKPLTSTVKSPGPPISTVKSPGPQTSTVKKTPSPVKKAGVAVKSAPLPKRPVSTTLVPKSKTNGDSKTTSIKPAVSQNGVRELGNASKPIAPRVPTTARVPASKVATKPEIVLKTKPIGNASQTKPTSRPMTAKASAVSPTKPGTAEVKTTTLKSRTQLTATARTATKVGVTAPDAKTTVGKLPTKPIATTAVRQTSRALPNGTSSTSTATTAPSRSARPATARPLPTKPIVSSTSVPASRPATARPTVTGATGTRTLSKVTTAGKPEVKVPTSKPLAKPPVKTVPSKTVPNNVTTKTEGPRKIINGPMRSKQVAARQVAANGIKSKEVVANNAKVQVNAPELKAVAAYGLDSKEIATTNGMKSNEVVQINGMESNEATATVPESIEIVPNILECIEVATTNVPESNEIVPNILECIEVATTNVPESNEIVPNILECIEVATTNVPESNEIVPNILECIEVATTNVPESNEIVPNILESIEVATTNGMESNEVVANNVESNKDFEINSPELKADAAFHLDSNEVAPTNDIESSEVMVVSNTEVEVNYPELKADAAFHLDSNEVAPTNGMEWNEVVENVPESKEVAANVPDWNNLVATSLELKEGSTKFEMESNEVETIVPESKAVATFDLDSNEVAPTNGMESNEVLAKVPKSIEVDDLIEM